MGLELGFPHIDARRFPYKQRDALVLKAQAFNQPQADDGLAQAHPIAQKRAVKPMTSILPWVMAALVWNFHLLYTRAWIWPLWMARTMPGTPVRKSSS